MRNKRKQKKLLIFTIGLLVLSIGFAALAANLKIDGTVNVSKTSWDVHFENVQVTQGSVTATTAPVCDDLTTTEITYAVNFTKPGEFYEFTVDMANDGTIDAMIDTLVNGLFEVDGETAKTMPDYLSSSIKYNDGVDIAQNHKLAAGTSEKIKVRVEFRTDIDPSDLPSTAGESMKFILKANFKQADNTAVDRNPKPNRIAPTVGETHKGIVYMDPTDVTVQCNASNSVSTTGTKTGCMKFYIYDDSGDNYKLILDHNTTSYIGYNCDDYEYVAYEQAPIKNQVDIDTAGWVGNPRLITINEITAITGNTTFDGSSNAFYAFGANSDVTYSYQTEEQKTRQRSFSWLFNNTRGCALFGCSIEDSSEHSSLGYWTSSPVIDETSYAWMVTYGGDVVIEYVCNDGFYYGIRPVITLSKSQISG